MELMLRGRLAMRVPVALWRLCGPAARRGASAARILMFHGTPRRLARELERQLRYLARRFDVVPLLDLANGGDPCKMALTFDDGLRSNVEVAYPILRRLGLPATFFVCPALVDERRWLWNHEARARLRALGADAPAAERLVERMKAMDLATRRAVEERLRDETADWRPTPAQREEHELAGWDELARLDPALITIGSHTLTHPILTRLAREDAEREILGSRALLEKRLERKVELFCYPNGELSESTVELARRGYRAAVTTAEAAVPPGCDPLLLPRLAAPRGLLRLAWLVQP